jgi:UDP-N-acetylmuramate dehydrogenase
VPSAWFLEQVGAKGMKQGGIEVADYHANLIYNAGGGTARDLLRIVDELKRRVRQHWDIPLEEEVQYVGFEGSADFSRHAGN